jgi:hypothetical protein
MADAVEVVDAPELAIGAAVDAVVRTFIAGGAGLLFVAGAGVKPGVGFTGGRSGRGAFCAMASRWRATIVLQASCKSGHNGGRGSGFQSMSSLEGRHALILLPCQENQSVVSELPNEHTLARRQSARIR